MPEYLLVEDSPSVRMVVASALRQVHQGLPPRIVEAATEQEGLDAFLSGHFDVVFLDMMLEKARPATDLLRAFLKARPDARVVLLTGLEREHPEVVEAISMGAFGYVRKPVRLADIRGVLDELSIEEGKVRRIQ